MLTETHAETSSIVTKIPLVSAQNRQQILAIEQKPISMSKGQMSKGQVDSIAVDKPKVCPHHFVRCDLTIYLFAVIGFVTCGLVLGMLVQRPHVVSAAIGYGAGAAFTVWVARLSLNQRENAVGKYNHE